MIPGSINNALISGAEGGYAISRSLRFNSSDSAYLSRTPASAGNRKTWTWAGWVKRSEIGGASPSIWGCQVGAGNPRDVAQFPTDKFAYEANTTGSSWNVSVITTQVFRDASAWYHFVLAVDTTQATAADRIKIFVNGSQITSFSTATYPSQNADLPTNQSQIHYLGASTGANYFNGYLADIHFIDGQALDPTSFGEFSATTGVWMPKAYSGGSYGTNGFHLDFSNNASAAALGTDSSGNGNTWTVNNLSVTAGAGNDSLVDVPTNGSEVDTGSGGQVRGNYATLNPLARGANSSQITLSNGNLDALWSSAVDYAVAVGTIGVSTGKWYWEVTHTQSGTRTMIGVIQSSGDLANYIGKTGPAYDSAGYTWKDDANTAATSYAVNDVVGIALDLDNGKIWFSKNGTWLGSGNPAGNSNPVYSSLSGTYFPAISEGDSNSPIGVTCNWGARPFAYTAPSGFKALCTANLPAPVVTKPSTVMDVALYTGNGTARNITGLGFSPDMVWIKSRSAVGNHRITDIVRGVTKELSPDLTNAEGTDANGVTAFNSDGFSLGISSFQNGSGTTYAAWCWDAGSSTVTNTQGSISSQVRANASAGFSIVTWTGDGVGGRTVGHGLGVAPAFVVIKQRIAGPGTDLYNWNSYHSALGATKFIALNTTSAAITAPLFNDTAPTSTVFSLGSSTSNYQNVNNASGVTYVAYAWAPLVGYSSMGSWTGNGSATSGPFVYTGFRPRWILTKVFSGDTGNWHIIDTARGTYNQTTNFLYPNLSQAETAPYGLDVLSNGFRITTTDANFNLNGAQFLYFAIAESPFNYARAR